MNYWRVFYPQNASTTLRGRTVMATNAIFNITSSTPAFSTIYLGTASISPLRAPHAATLTLLRCALPHPHTSRNATFHASPRVCKTLPAAAALLNTIPYIAEDSRLRAPGAARLHRRVNLALPVCTAQPLTAPGAQRTLSRRAWCGGQLHARTRGTGRRHLRHRARAYIAPPAVTMRTWDTGG